MDVSQLGVIGQEVYLMKVVLNFFPAGEKHLEVSVVGLRVGAAE